MTDHFRDVPITVRHTMTKDEQLAMDEYEFNVSAPLTTAEKMDEYVRRLRTAWLNPSDHTAQMAVHNYENRIAPEFVREVVDRIFPRAQAHTHTELAPQKRWDAWTDKSTGIIMLSRVEGDRVLVRELHSIHEPGSMSVSEFKERFGR